MRKLRRIATAEERRVRHELQAREKAQDAAAMEDAIEERIRRNIELYGP